MTSQESCCHSNAEMYYEDINGVRIFNESKFKCKDCGEIFEDDIFG